MDSAISLPHLNPTPAETHKTSESQPILKAGEFLLCSSPPYMWVSIRIST